MTLIERLVQAAELWARENQRSLARLATIVVNDGKLFDRIAGGGSCTVATYERLMDHLRDPTSWSGPIPCEALQLLNLSAPVASVAACPRCDIVAEHPAVRCCTSPQCPMRAQEAA